MGSRTDETSHLTSQKATSDKGSGQNGEVGLTPFETSDVSKTEDASTGDHHGKGLTVVTAIVFLFGEMAGTGILSLPYALNGLGYAGIVILLLITVVSAYTGKVLADCMLIVQERYSYMRQDVRYPFPAMGQITFGTKGRVLVSVLIDLNMFGSSIVFLILGSDNVYGLLVNLAGVRVPFCLLLIIVAAILCPITWLGTPKDFWLVAVGATISSVVACVLVIVSLCLDADTVTEGQPVRHSAPSAIRFFTALGTVCFAYGGQAAFPTFQNDMKDRTKFGKAVCFGFFFLNLAYMPSAVTGFVLYGDLLKPNVLDTLPPGPTVQVVQILMTCHLMMAFVIILNPVLQEVEELLHLPAYFSWKRVVSRSALVAFSLFVAETVPQFGAILSLCGGTFLLVGFLCPSVFYIRLCQMEGPWPKIFVPLHKRVLLIEISIVACLIGAAATYCAFVEIVSPNALSLPCYVCFT